MAIPSIVHRSASVVAVLAGLTAVAVPAHAATVVPSCERICVLDARAGAHPDYDRLVFDLTNNALPPTVRARVSSDGSYRPGASDEDRKLQITGKSYIFLDIDPTDVAGPTSPDAYTSPTVQPVSLPSLKGIQMASAGGYEMDHTTTFGLSLGDYSQYKVFTLTSPNRIVVDVYH